MACMYFVQLVMMGFVTDSGAALIPSDCFAMTTHLSVKLEEHFPAAGKEKQTD